MFPLSSRLSILWVDYSSEVSGQVGKRILEAESPLTVMHLRMLGAQAARNIHLRDRPGFGGGGAARWRNWSSFVSLLGKSQALGIQLRTAVISFIHIVPKIPDWRRVVYEISLKKIYN